MSNFPSRTIVGFPNIGENRELKTILELFWKGDLTEEQLMEQSQKLQFSQFTKIAELGLTENWSIPNTFSLYDNMLDQAIKLNVIPKRFADQATGVTQYFDMARGKGDKAAVEMSKWMNTNYHYLVPEFDVSTEVKYNPDTFLNTFNVAPSTGPSAESTPAAEKSVRPYIIGPVTFLFLSKYFGVKLQDFVEPVFKAYYDLLADYKNQGFEWIQIDEPILVSENLNYDPALLQVFTEQFYNNIGQFPKVFVTTPYDELPQNLFDTLVNSKIDVLHIDWFNHKNLNATGTTPSGKPATPSKEGEFTELIYGVVNGRNIWANDINLTGIAPGAKLATSSSLRHIPYTKTNEPSIKSNNPALFQNLAFGYEKIQELVSLGTEVKVEQPEIAEQARNDELGEARNGTETSPSTGSIEARVAGIVESDFERESYEERVREQIELPFLPTTTIGSFPQTPEIRKARAGFKAGKLTLEEYKSKMFAEIDDAIDRQVEIGLDVLVHGEPERNDMVQFFCEQFTGCTATENGWVQSYGSRCTKPSLIFGDVDRKQAMTTEWSGYATKYALEKYNKPMKGMLTAPTTIMAWSFVRNDKPLKEVAYQIGLALRDETKELEQVGINIIQVDEPAIREILPLKKSEHKEYYNWSVNAFKLATSGVKPSTQIHSHFCYSDFNEIVNIIDNLDADVISIEASRSKMDIVEALSNYGYDKGVGPGVYDIHSPRIPSKEEIKSLITLALEKTKYPEKLWINPDCGLKTRKWDETMESLKNMVDARNEVNEKYDK
jgi:5-methyltetrahydropteroyltriglutamate--homocysteine methyltransferase